MERFSDRFFGVYVSTFTVQHAHRSSGKGEEKNKTRQNSYYKVKLFHCMKSRSCLYPVKYRQLLSQRIFKLGNAGEVPKRMKTLCNSFCWRKVQLIKALPLRESMTEKNT